MITFKLIGCIFIIVSSSIIGIEYGRKYTDRLNNLIYIQNCIQMLETEVVYSSTQIPDALYNISTKANKSVSFLFDDIRKYLEINKDKSLFECFKFKLDESRCKLCLEDEDVEIILSLARTLGASDVFDQQKHFKTAIMNLEINQQDAKEKKLKNVKMYKSLGVLFGTALVLILY